MSAAVTAIVAPLREELAAVLNATTARRRVRAGALEAWRGRIGASEVVLARTGDGPRRAGGGLEALLEAFPVTRVVVVGVAGGLTADLAPGTVVVASRVLDGRQPAPEPDPGLVALARDCGATAVTALTARRVLCTRAEKENARLALPHEGPAVVDVESSALAGVAARHGLPYVVLRAVCDGAGEALPFDLNACADELGSVSRSKVLRYALLHPAVIGSLWELRQRVARCSRELARVVAVLLDRTAENAHAAPARVALES